MKVQDLKRVLKARGLSTAGNKSELVERLQTIGDAPKDIPQDLHGVISSLESLGSRNMMAKEDEVTSENNDITAAPTATLPDVQRNLQSQELPGSFEAATEDGGSLPMTAKVDTEEYVDCADELLTETTSAPTVDRDSALSAPPTLLGDAQGQDGLQCHTPVQFPETNTLTDSGPTAKESLYEHKDRKATVATVHAMIAEYEGQARRIPRMYILHVGMNDLLQGHQPDAIVECLENKWRTRQGALVVCSIPEVTSRGKEMQAAAMLLNARLKKMCKKIRAKYVDLTRDLAITATMQKDGLHYNKEGTHVVTGRLAEVAGIFLGERRKRRSNTGGHWYPKQLDEKSLTQSTEEVVHHQVRRRGLEGSQVHDSRPEAPSPSRETWMGYPPRPRFKSDTRGQVVRPIMECATMQGSALPEKKSLMGELAPSRERTPAVPVPTCLHLRQMPPSTCMDPPCVAMPNPRQMSMGLYPFVPNSSIPGCYPLDPRPWIQTMVAQTVRRQLETTAQE
ncbi:hypothetical protein ISCGN_006729, partial [Ixodes scapularis]